MKKTKTKDQRNHSKRLEKLTDNQLVLVSGGDYDQEKKWW
jgi:hypothetical protein